MRIAGVDRAVGAHSLGPRGTNRRFHEGTPHHLPRLQIENASDPPLRDVRVSWCAFFGYLSSKDYSDFELDLGGRVDLT